MTCPQLHLRFRGRKAPPLWFVLIIRKKKCTCSCVSLFFVSIKKKIYGYKGVQPNITKNVFFFQTETHWGNSSGSLGAASRNQLPLTTSSSTSQCNASQPAGAQCPTVHHSCLTGRKIHPCPALWGTLMPAIIMESRGN